MLGGVLLERGELEAAEGALTKAMEMIELTGDKESLVAGYATLTHLCQIQGKSTRALDAIQKIESLLSENTSYGAALWANFQLREAERDPSQLQAALEWSGECALELNGEQDMPAILSQGEWPYAEQLISGEAAYCAGTGTLLASGTGIPAVGPCIPGRADSHRCCERLA